MYIATERPVPLHEFAVVDSIVRTPTNKCIRKLKSTKPNSDLLQLLQEIIPDKSALVFCETKSACEQTAEALAKEVSQELLLHRVCCHETN